MRVAYVASEVFPYSKTGGLADVAGALPAALAGLGHDVTVFTPWYPSARSLVNSQVEDVQSVNLSAGIWIGDTEFPVTYHWISADGCRIVFVANDALFDRPSPYLDGNGRDYEDNVARFSFFCRAVLEYYVQSGSPVPDVWHVNDWQSSLLPLYLKSTYAGLLPDPGHSLLTIHNLGYQGVFPAEQIYFTGLDWGYFHHELLEYYGSMNLLKAGIVASDAVTTVSPTYAREIQTEAGGAGLDGVIRASAGKLAGILNGIDSTLWDPATDDHLPANYSISDLDGKGLCKQALQKEFGLPADPESLLLGVVSRLDQQKGIDLVLDSAGKFAAHGVQLVMLGSGNLALQQQAETLHEEFADSFGLSLAFDERIAHLIYAGADALLMPSLYEPCGLNQMYAQRYGTVPVVRETGGLKDTVINVTPARLSRGVASGFTFRALTAAALQEAVAHAKTLYTFNREAWTGLMRSIMGLDHSWPSRARQYERLYLKLAKGKAPRGNSNRGTGVRVRSQPTGAGRG